MVSGGPPARARVLIVQPGMRSPGGTQGVAAWMIQALVDRYHVGLVTWTPVDFPAVNRWFGTSIDPSKVTVHRVPRLARLAGSVPTPLALLNSTLLVRYARRIAAGYDVLISAENEADLGRPAIQYVHYPRLLRPRPQSDFRWYHRSRVALEGYYRLCDWLLGGAPERIAANLTLANSAWTAERMRRSAPGVVVDVLYPAVVHDAPVVDWKDRESGFVCVGRFVRDKQFDRVISILDAVRAVIPGIHLHIAGTRGSAADYRALAAVARRHAAWVQVHEGLARPALAALMATHRYGIHGKPDEHFGVAPAEMVRAGAIVFVPDDGGQVEIVGDERLIYRTDAEAVDKIIRVLRSPSEQAALRASLAPRGERFAPERFMSGIRRAVQTSLDSQGGGA